MSTLVDALGIGIVGLGLSDARRGFLKIGLGLLNARSCPAHTRALLAVIEAGEHRALGHSIPHIRPKVDENAGHLEPDLGCHTRLNRSEAEDLDCDVGLGVRDFHVDGAEKQSPRADAHGRNHCKYERQQKHTSMLRGGLPRTDDAGISRASHNGRDVLHCGFWHIEHQQCLSRGGQNA